MANDTQIIEGLLLYLLCVIIVLTLIFGGTSPTIGTSNLMTGSASDFMQPISADEYGIVSHGGTHYNVSATRGLYVDYLDKSDRLTSMATCGATFGKVSFNVNGTPAVSETYQLKGMTDYDGQTQGDNLCILMATYTHLGVLTDSYWIDICDVGDGYNTFYLHELQITGSQDIRLCTVPVSDSYNFTYYYDYVSGYYDLYIEGTCIDTNIIKTYDYTTQDALNSYKLQTRDRNIYMDNDRISILSCYYTFQLKQLTADTNSLVNLLFKIAVFDVSQDLIPFWLQVPFINVPEVIIIWLIVRLIRSGSG